MVKPSIFSEKSNWKENPFIMKLLSWKTFPSKKAYFWPGRFSFQCLTVDQTATLGVAFGTILFTLAGLVVRN